MLDPSPALLKLRQDWLSKLIEERNRAFELLYQATRQHLLPLRFALEFQTRVKPGVSVPLRRVWQICTLDARLGWRLYVIEDDGRYSLAWGVSADQGHTPPSRLEVKYFNSSPDVQNELYLDHIITAAEAMAAFANELRRALYVNA